MSKSVFNDYYGKKLHFYAVYCGTSKEKDKTFKNAENTKRITVLLRSVANPELNIYLDHVWVKHVAGLNNLKIGDYIAFDAKVVRYERKYVKTTYLKYHSLPPKCGLDFLTDIVILAPDEYGKLTEPTKRKKTKPKKKKTLPCSDYFEDEIPRFATLEKLP